MTITKEVEAKCGSCNDVISSCEGCGDSFNVEGEDIVCVGGGDNRHHYCDSCYETCEVESGDLVD